MATTEQLAAGGPERGARELREIETVVLKMDHALDANDLQAANQCIEEAERALPNSMYGYLLRGRLLVHQDETESALEIAREGLLRGLVADVKVVRELLSLVAKLGGRVTVGSTPINPAIRDFLEPSALFSIGKQLVSYGDVVRARILGQWIVSASPNSSALVEAHFGTGDEGGPAEVDWDADFICIEEPGSDLAIVVFTGLNHQVGVPLAELYERLRPLKAHFVALRDMKRLLFLGDLPYLGSSPGESAPLLRSRIETMGASRIVVLGNSAGGFGALLYGGLMKADAIVGYAAVAQIDLPAESRRFGVKRRIEAKASTWMAAPGCRLRAMEPPIPILLNYGADMALDARQAESLASTPGVRLRPLPGYAQHSVLVELIKTDRFLPELRQFLGEVDPSLLEDQQLQNGS